MIMMIITISISISIPSVVKMIKTRHQHHHHRGRRYRHRQHPRCHRMWLFQEQHHQICLLFPLGMNTFTLRSKERNLTFYPHRICFTGGITPSLHNNKPMPPNPLPLAWPIGTCAAIERTEQYQEESRRRSSTEPARMDRSSPKTKKTVHNLHPTRSNSSR